MKPFFPCSTLLSKDFILINVKMPAVKHLLAGQMTGFGDVNLNPTDFGYLNIYLQFNLYAQLS